MEGFLDVSTVIAGGFEGRRVRLRGWVHGKKSLDDFRLLFLRDGTGIIQCVLKRGVVDKRLLGVVERLPVESTVELTGVVERDLGVVHSYKVLVEDVKVVREAERGFPINKENRDLGFLLDKRHLWLRSERMWAVLRVRAKVLKAAREWFDAHGFMEVHGPTLISLPDDARPDFFEVKYFDRRAYLTQGFQPYAEALLPSLGKVYTIAPFFRAERSREKRYLTEYWGIDAVEPWCKLGDIMKVQEGLLTHICHTLSRDAAEEFESLGIDARNLLRVQASFPRITYDEAIRILQKDGVDIWWGRELNAKHEAGLASHFDKPFFVTHYPVHGQTLFYKSDPERSELTLTTDLIAPEGYGEISSGGQMIDDLDELLNKMRGEGLKPEDYGWHIDLLRYGSLPHSGFMIGVERTLTWICKLRHVMEAIAFPRLFDKIYP